MATTPQDPRLRARYAPQPGPRIAPGSAGDVLPAGGFAAQPGFSAEGQAFPTSVAAPGVGVGAGIPATPGIAQQPIGAGGAPAVAPPSPVPIPPTATGLGARIKAAYNEASKRVGRQLAWDDPTTLLIWQVLGNLTPEQAMAASRQGAEYAQRYGRLLSDAEVDQVVTETKTANPNQYDVGYDLGDAVQQAFQNVQAQYPTEKLTGYDPRLLAAVRANPELANITPEQLDQIVQAGRTFTWTTGQMAGSGLDTMIGQAIKRPPVPLPHQMNAGAFEALYGVNADPTAKALAEAALKRRGWDPATYERQHYAARPTGTAAPTSSTAWGGTSGVWG